MKTGQRQKKTGQRQNEDRPETERRQARDRMKTGQRQNEDRPETGRRQARDRKKTGQRQKEDRPETKRRQKGSRVSDLVLYLLFLSYIIAVKGLMKAATDSTVPQYTLIICVLNNYARACVCMSACVVWCVYSSPNIKHFFFLTVHTYSNVNTLLPQNVYRWKT